jgi:hypothetical protein
MLYTILGGVGGYIVAKVFIEVANVSKQKQWLGSSADWTTVIFTGVGLIAGFGAGVALLATGNHPFNSQ